MRWLFRPSTTFEFLRRHVDTAVTWNHKEHDGKYLLRLNWYHLSDRQKFNCPSVFALDDTDNVYDGTSYDTP